MERVQELLYELKLIFEQNDFSEIPVFAIVLWPLKQLKFISDMDRPILMKF